MGVNGAVYPKNRRTNPLKRNGPRPRPLADRFWEKVDKSGECWAWFGNRLPKGYGKIMVLVDGRKRMALAHRVSWEIANGRSVPDGMMVCHSCDTPSCVRPDHLWLGTANDNRRDCSLKGRDRTPRRVPGAWPHSAITREQAAELRLLGLSHRQAASVYGICKSTYYNVMRDLKTQGGES